MSIEKSLDLFIDITGIDYLVLRWIHPKLVVTKYSSIKKADFEADYTVVDKEAPKIIADEDIYLEPGEELDIDKYILCGELYYHF